MAPARVRKLAEKIIDANFFASLDVLGRHDQNAILWMAWSVIMTTIAVAIAVAIPVAFARTGQIVVTVATSVIGVRTIGDTDWVMPVPTPVGVLGLGAGMVEHGEAGMDVEIGEATIQRDLNLGFECYKVGEQLSQHQLNDPRIEVEVPEDINSQA